MPTIYLYAAEEQVVQQIGSAGLPATLRLDVSPDENVQCYEVVDGIPSSLRTIVTVDIKLQPVVDDTPPQPDPVRPSIEIFMWAGEIPYLASSPISLLSADVQLQVSADENVPTVPTIEGVTSNLIFLQAVDILVRPVDYFISGGVTDLIVQETLHGLSADSITLTEAITLVVQEALHGHTADNVDLELSITLIVQEVFHGHTVDGIALTQEHILIVTETNHSHSADGVALTQAHNLAVDEAQHILSSDVLTLIQLHILAVLDSLHNVTTDDIILQVLGQYNQEKISLVGEADCHKEFDGSTNDENLAGVLEEVGISGSTDRILITGRVGNKIQM